jgi:hypothetical protein
MTGDKMKGHEGSKRPLEDKGRFFWVEREATAGLDAADWYQPVIALSHSAGSVVNSVEQTTEGQDGSLETIARIQERSDGDLN